MKLVHEPYLMDPTKYLTSYVKSLSQDSNSVTSFIWDVFAIGSSHTLSVKCDMKVEHTDECAIQTHNEGSKLQRL